EPRPRSSLKVWTRLSYSFFLPASWADNSPTFGSMARHWRRLTSIPATSRPFRKSRGTAALRRSPRMTQVCSGKVTQAGVDTIADVFETRATDQPLTALHG